MRPQQSNPRTNFSSINRILNSINEPSHAQTQSRVMFTTFLSQENKNLSPKKSSDQQFVHSESLNKEGSTMKKGDDTVNLAKQFYGINIKVGRNKSMKQGQLRKQTRPAMRGNDNCLFVQKQIREFKFAEEAKLKNMLSSPINYFDTFSRIKTPQSVTRSQRRSKGQTVLSGASIFKRTEKKKLIDELLALKKPALNISITPGDLAGHQQDGERSITTAVETMMADMKNSSRSPSSISHVMSEGRPMTFIEAKKSMEQPLDEEKEARQRERVNKKKSEKGLSKIISIQTSNQRFMGNRSRRSSCASGEYSTKRSKPLPQTLHDIKKFSTILNKKPLFTKEDEPNGKPSPFQSRHFSVGASPNSMFSPQSMNPAIEQYCFNQALQYQFQNYQTLIQEATDKESDKTCGTGIITEKIGMGSNHETELGLTPFTHRLNNQEGQKKFDNIFIVDNNNMLGWLDQQANPQLLVSINNALPTANQLNCIRNTNLEQEFDSKEVIMNQPIRLKEFRVDDEPLNHTVRPTEVVRTSQSFRDQEPKPASEIYQTMKPKKALELPRANSNSSTNIKIIRRNSSQRKPLLSYLQKKNHTTLNVLQDSKEKTSSDPRFERGDEDGSPDDNLQSMRYGVNLLPSMSPGAKSESHLHSPLKANERQSKKRVKKTKTREDLKKKAKLSNDATIHKNISIDQIIQLSHINTENSAEKLANLTSPETTAHYDKQRPQETQFSPLSDKKLNISAPGRSTQYDRRGRNVHSPNTSNREVLSNYKAVTNISSPHHPEGGKPMLIHIKSTPNALKDSPMKPEPEAKSIRKPSPLKEHSKKSNLSNAMVITGIKANQPYTLITLEEKKKSQNGSMDQGSPLARRAEAVTLGPSKRTTETVSVLLPIDEKKPSLYRQTPQGSFKQVGGQIYKIDCVDNSRPQDNFELKLKFLKDKRFSTRKEFRFRRGSGMTTKAVTKPAFDFSTKTVDKDTLKMGSSKFDSLNNSRFEFTRPVKHNEIGLVVNKARVGTSEEKKREILRKRAQSLAAPRKTPSAIRLIDSISAQEKEAILEQIISQILALSASDDEVGIRRSQFQNLFNFPLKLLEKYDEGQQLEESPPPVNIDQVVRDIVAHLPLEASNHIFDHYKKFINETQDAPEDEKVRAIQMFFSAQKQFIFGHLPKLRVDSKQKRRNIRKFLIHMDRLEKSNSPLLKQNFRKEDYEKMAQLHLRLQTTLKLNVNEDVESPNQEIALTRKYNSGIFHRSLTTQGVESPEVKIKLRNLEETDVIKDRPEERQSSQDASNRQHVYRSEKAEDPLISRVQIFNEPNKNSASRQLSTVQHTETRKVQLSAHQPSMSSAEMKELMIKVKAESKGYTMEALGSNFDLKRQTTPNTHALQNIQTVPGQILSLGSRPLSQTKVNSADMDGYQVSLGRNQVLLNTDNSQFNMFDYRAKAEDLAGPSPQGLKHLDAKSRGEAALSINEEPSSSVGGEHIRMFSRIMPGSRQFDMTNATNSEKDPRGDIRTPVLGTPPSYQNNPSSQRISQPVRTVVGPTMTARHETGEESLRLVMHPEPHISMEQILPQASNDSSQKTKEQLLSQLKAFEERRNPSLKVKPGTEVVKQKVVDFKYILRNQAKKRGKQY